RFQFPSSELIYPLKITSLSVKDRTEALFYVLTDGKIDIPQAKLEYAKKLGAADLAKLDKGPVPIPQSSQLYHSPVQSWDFKGLKGWLKEGQYLTKVRRTFAKSEMTDDLRIGKAKDQV